MVGKVHEKFESWMKRRRRFNRIAEDDDYKFYLHHSGATDQDE